MKGRFLRLAILTIALLVLLTSFSFGQGYNRRITAWFNNIKININGRVIQTQNEPLIYNDVLYIPAIEVMDALFIGTSYRKDLEVLEIRNNYDLVEKLRDDSLNLTYEDWLFLPHEKDIRLSILQRELDTLQKQVKLLEEELDYYTYRYGQRYRHNPYYPIATVWEMQGYLYTYFNRIADVPVNISLTHSSGNLYVLSITSPSLGSSLNNLPKRFIEYYIEDAFAAIKNCLNANARIEGTVKQINSSYVYEDITTFRTVSNRLVFTHR